MTLTLFGDIVTSTSNGLSTNALGSRHDPQTLDPMVSPFPPDLSLSLSLLGPLSLFS